MSFPPLTPETKALTLELNRAWSIPWKWSWTAQDITRIETIGRSREAAAIPQLAQCVVHGSAAIRGAALTAIGQLIASIEPYGLRDLHDLVRGFFDDDVKWQDFGNLPEFSNVSQRLTTLGLLASHRSGHVREAAVAQLALSQDGGELVHLIAHTNDWVPQVLARARQAVMDRVPRQTPEELSRLLPLILRMARGDQPWAYGHYAEETLRSAGLADIKPVRQRAIVDLALRHLAQPESDDVCRRLLAHTDPVMGRACIRGLEAMNSPRAIPLLWRALDHPDQWVRIRATELLLRLTADADLPVLCEKLVHYRHPFIRRKALTALADRVPGAGEAALREALLDRHDGLRYMAQFYLQKRHELDLRAFYLEAVARESGRRLTAAIIGLGERGLAEDALLIKSRLSSPVPSVRTAAVTAMGKLAPDVFIEELVNALADQETGVSKASREVLGRRVGSVAMHFLRPLLAAEQPEHVRRNALRLVGARSLGPQEIGAVLQCCAAAPPEWAREVQAAVWRCITSGATPTERQLELTQEACRHTGDFYPGHLDLERLRGQFAFYRSRG